MEKRLNIWYHKYLSRAGILMLIKDILEATSVYWMSLAWTPRGILSRIQVLCCKFLWKGKQIGRIFTWVKWEALTLPKKWGGWGIKKLEDFSSALVTKIGWHVLTINKLWTKVACSKYIAPSNLMDWISQPQRLQLGVSIIWKVVTNSLNIIKDDITWKFSLELK